MIKKLTNTIFIDREVSHAFGTDEDVPVGSIVQHPGDFLGFIEHGLKTVEPRDGTSFLILPKSAYELVLCGDGPQTGKPYDYRVAVHRGSVSGGPYLNRVNAGTTSFCAVVAMTPKAYREDPEMSGQKFTEWNFRGDEQIITAVIASCAGAAYPFRTLINNMAGMNKGFLLKSTMKDIEHIRKLMEDSHREAGHRGALEELVADAALAHDWADMAKASMAQWDKDFSIVAG